VEKNWSIRTDHLRGVSIYLCLKRSAASLANISDNARGCGIATDKPLAQTALIRVSLSRKQIMRHFDYLTRILQISG